MLIKIVTRIVLFLGLLLSVGIPPASAVPILSIAPVSQAVQPGQSFSLNINISSVTDLYAFQFDLTFDPFLLSASSITEGPFLPSGGTTIFLPGSIDNATGAITLTSDTLVGPILGVSGSDILATVDFQALTTEGTSPITVSNVILLDSNLGDIAANTVDGTVTVRQTVTEIPEPTTWLLLATGCLSLVAFGWRWKGIQRRTI